MNSGRTEHLTGQAPVAGDVAGFAMPPLPRHGDHHRRRHARPQLPPPVGQQREDLAEITVSGLTGGVSFTSLSYVSPAAGWVVIS